MKDKSLIRDILFFLLVFAIIGVAIITQSGSKNDGTDRKIVGIHIKGEVEAPGYYELEYGSRIKDALLAAGSETENANLSEINLALKLADGEEIVIPAKGGSDSEKQSDLININTADMYRLCKLDGIGEALASNIINYRAEKGSFKSINDLKKVGGIGSSKFDKIKDKITVQ